MQTKPNVSLPEQDDIVVELTCRACNFEGTSSSDIKEHKSQHVSLTCLKCHFVAGRDDKLKQHILFKHVAPYDKISIQSFLQNKATSINVQSVIFYRKRSKYRYE